MLPEAVWMLAPSLSVHFASGVPDLPDFRFAKRICAQSSQLAYQASMWDGGRRSETVLPRLQMLEMSVSFCSSKNDGSLRPRMKRGFLDAEMWHSAHGVLGAALLSGGRTCLPSLGAQA